MSGINSYLSAENIFIIKYLRLNMENHPMNGWYRRYKISRLEMKDNSWMVGRWEMIKVKKESQTQCIKLLNVVRKITKYIDNIN